MLRGAPISSGSVELTATDDIKITGARPKELEVVVSIFEEAGQWLQARGIDQWPSQVPERMRAHLAQQITRGEIYLAWLHRQPVGTLTLQWSDPHIWGEQLPDAGYVHGLAIRRAVAGRGIGRRMLDWAATQVIAANRPYLRLDCLATNQELCQYYERAGFTRCGHVEHDRWPAQLFQKPLREAQ